MLLAKHLTDPDANKEAEFTEEGEKEMLNTFDEMMKTFATLLLGNLMELAKKPHFTKKNSSLKT